MLSKFYLSRFEVSNYKPFEDPIILDLNNKIGTNIAIIGDNGSGKSSLLEAISDLEYLIKCNNEIRIGIYKPRVPVSNINNPKDKISFKYTLRQSEGMDINISYTKYNNSNDIKDLIINNNDLIEDIKDNISIHYFDLNNIKDNLIYLKVLTYIVKLGLLEEMINYFKSKGMCFRFKESDLILKPHSIELSHSEMALIVIFFTRYYISNRKGNIILLDNLEIFNSPLKESILNDLSNSNNGSNQLFITSLYEVDGYENIKLMNK